MGLREKTRQESLKLERSERLNVVREETMCLNYCVVTKCGWVHLGFMKAVRQRDQALQTPVKENIGPGGGGNVEGIRRP